MSIGGRIKRVHPLDILEEVDKKESKLAQASILNGRKIAIDNSSSANWTQDRTTVTNGDITLSANWMQDGTTVTNGDITLEVGSSITGYEANGISDWYVLGAEDGRLLITTNSCPERVGLIGREGYTHGVEILNTVAKKYTNPIYADGARSITVDDINRVTGYNSETAGFGANTLGQYGNEVTFYWDGTYLPYYSGSNGVTGNLDWDHHSGFFYPTIDGFKRFRKPTPVSRPNMQEITKLTSTNYLYSAKDYLTESMDAYGLLFKGEYYWLGSQCVDCATGIAHFGLRGVGGGNVGYFNLAYSDGDDNGAWMGLRPVVTLKSNIQINKDGKICE